MNLKEGKTQEDLYEVLTVFASKMDVDAPYPPIAWGESLEEPGKRYGMVLGWNSSKVNFTLLFFYLSCPDFPSLGTL